MLPNSKKGFYHSELVAETQAAPVWITPTDDGQVVRESRDGGFYMRCRVNEQPYMENGQEVDRYYNIENATIAAHLRQIRHGKWYQVQAGGSRDAATLMIHDQENNLIPPPESATASAPPSSGSPAPAPAQSGPPSSAPNRSAAGPGAPPQSAPQNGNGRSGPSYEEVVEATLEIARRVVGRFYSRHGRRPSDEELRIAIHLAIGHQHHPSAKLADPNLQNVGAVIRGKETAAPAAHEQNGASQPPEKGPVEAMAEGAKQAAAGPQEPAGVGAAGSPFEEDDDELPF